MVVQTSESAGQEHDLPVTLGVLMLALLPAALDQTVLATALPAVGGELGGHEYDFWIVPVYMLAMVASAVPWGRLGDRLGRKPLFMASTAIFLVGSALCGLAWNLDSLMAFRVLQGFGAGGVVVLTQAIAGDLGPPRDRGRYQGMLGAIFGVASIAGPIVGGVFVDHLSWRWIFLINLPIGVIVLSVIVIVLQQKLTLEQHRTDYLGMVLLVGAVSLMMTTTLGMFQYSWDMPYVIGVSCVVVALAVGWGFTERRAADPVLPPRLFRRPVFSTACAIDFIVGFLMFGTVVYAPLFLQIVAGDSAAVSGLHLLPMVLGVLVMAIVSGHMISRTGRYRRHAILGMALTALGLLLCSRIDESTSTITMSLYLGVLGCGLGLAVQVPVIAAQNAVDYRDLGVATSGVTLFRALGGLMGIIFFSATLSHQLAVRISRIVDGVHLPPGLTPTSATRDPRLLSGLPPADRVPFADAVAQSFQTMLQWSVPVALAGLVLALSLREVPLRITATVPAIGELFGGAPTVRSSRHEIERLLSQLMRCDAKTPEKIKETYGRLGADAGTDCPPGSLWALCRIARNGTVPPATLSGRDGVTVEDGRPFINRLIAEGLVTRQDGNITITEKGRALTERLCDCMREMLARLLDGWSPEDSPELADILTYLSRRSLGDDADLAILKAAPAG